MKRQVLRCLVLSGWRNSPQSVRLHKKTRYDGTPQTAPWRPRGAGTEPCCGDVPEKMYDRAVFKWVSKIMLSLLCFCFTSLSDWTKKVRATFSTNQKLIQNQSWLARTRFAALDANYLYLLQFLIGSFCFLLLLWLVRVITLALVLWHSFENRSNVKSNDFKGTVYPRDLESTATSNWNTRFPWLILLFYLLLVISNSLYLQQCLVYFACSRWREYTLKGKRGSWNRSQEMSLNVQ